MRLFSQMTLAELQEEMERLRQEMDDAKKRGDLSQYHVVERKFFIAKSYFVGTDGFRVGKSYRVHGHEAPFTVDYFNGVFAWGRFQGNGEQLGFPVGMLEEE
ncbi:YfhH family protein [Brevibacillus sp. SYP-B805]|uniref:YfhH family protein n=1 Tax=Brevibacillus sp. SYP-B805 TaxID=1578199 RepID=UPI0013EC500F|nr:YfhH family protein [Brevibacillus sp. SYP-B805]NGQ96326.1 YfhH family protein [Brevibacillus sp. SYP-B805]